MLDLAAVDAPPGPAWCRAWTDAVDAALRDWLARTASDRPVAVVALGGYARRQLCPASDVDLLLLHDGWPAEDLAGLVQALCYPLWDAGLSVGHAVRTVRESVRAAGERIDTATALTDRRLVAGDARLADDLAARMRRWLRRHGGSVLTDLAAADAARHAAAGPLPGMLEPDLKDGAGGLRDLHSLRWAAACVLGEVGLDPLVGARYLSAVDRAELARAGADLLTARCALHLVQGRNARDVLRLDLQDEVAALLGHGDADDLLHRVGLAARLVAHVHGRAWAPLLADATQGRRRRRPDPVALDEGIVLADGLVEVDAEADLRVEPAMGLRAVAAAAARGVHLGRSTAERLRRHAAAAQPLPWDAAARGALVGALGTGARGLGAIADADHLGLLAAHLPEWTRLRGRPQRNPLHRFDLDTHGFQAVCELVAIAEGSDGPTRAALWAELEDPDAVLVATLLHDVGKAWPGDHSVVGADVAARWTAQMGFAAAQVDLVRVLVRHHLLLPDAATRRDLDDPAEVRAVARAAGSVGALDALYLLSLADARATGPSAHSPWKDGLVAELHGRARGVLAEDAAALATAFDPVVAGSAARRAGDAGVDALLAGVDDRYVLAASAEQVAVHAGLLVPPPAGGDVRSAWRAGTAAGTEVLSVVGADRLGFMADCAGVLAGRGLRVLEARAFTRSAAAGGPPLALDWFVVEAGPDLDRRAVRDDLARVWAGEVTAGALVARWEARRGVCPPRASRDQPVTVRFELRDAVTRVEVHGPDAPGVLSRLAGELSAAGLELLGARVATLGREVRDVFFVRTPEVPPEGGWEGLEARLRVAAGWSEGAIRHSRT